MAGGGLRSTKNFLALLKDWPVDSTKKGRDLGEFLHKRVAQSLREGTIQDNNVSILNSCCTNKYYTTKEEERVYQTIRADYLSVCIFLALSVAVCMYPVGLSQISIFVKH